MGQTEILTYELRPAAEQPRGALVLLHGRGTDEFDLVPLFDLLDPDRRFVCVTGRGLVPGWLDSIEGWTGFDIGHTVDPAFLQELAPWMLAALA